MDPRGLIEASGLKPIYLNADCSIFCLVDPQDYDWACQWRWKAIQSRATRSKVYAFRTTRRERRHVAFWLHKEICLRRHGPPPDADHFMVDHLNGQSLHNAGENLRWSTPRQNQTNRYGLFARKLRVALLAKDLNKLLTSTAVTWVENNG